MKETIKGEVFIFRFKEAMFDVTGITLLSVEEAEALPVEIRNIDCWWWLRSPGDKACQYRAASVSYEGSISYGGSDVNYGSGAVRPALQIRNLKSLNLAFGDGVKIFDLHWTVIGDEMALCDTGINQMPFQSDRQAEDANDYEKSDVKKFLGEWLSDKMQTNKEETKNESNG